MKKYDLTIPFSELSLQDLNLVGGKNASLGEMFQKLQGRGIRVPDGFAITVGAYWGFVEQNGIKQKLINVLHTLDRKNFSNLKEVGQELRTIVQQSAMPDNIVMAIKEAYAGLGDGKTPASVAVRSSATAEDLPQASFAGQHDSFLNVSGEDQLISAVQACFTSMFTNRAIKYREDNKFDHMSIGLSVGVQRMVRSDLACSGIGFTLEPESGFRNIVQLWGVWGLGENIVQGTVAPDEFVLFKPNLATGTDAIISKKLGEKNRTLIYNDGNHYSFSNPIVNIKTPKEKREQFVLTDPEITKLGQWAVAIEEHYKRPMDIEWAKDGITNELYLLQARPETVRSLLDPYNVCEYHVSQKGKVLVSGEAIGSKISCGIARILATPKEIDRVNEGDILVAETTSPDWDPVMRKVAGIITDKGGRTSHASIVARELGVVAVVGASGATTTIKDGQLVTVSCAEGKTGFVYEGKSEWTEENINLHLLPATRTRPMLILADPEKAYKYSFYPSAGIGLLRMEFIISNTIRIHPMALVKFDQLTDEAAKAQIREITKGYEMKEDYFIDKLSESLATIACAFHPREVIVRLSDFKSNEYANLIGGQQFETAEENPMIGFRGASRYAHEKYKEAFRLECEAIKLVRNRMGLKNVKVMVPFCRTVQEASDVLATMAEYGLKRAENGLEVYVMSEIPSNVLVAEKFARFFDGFSIGSNDLTQLTLGIDRDSSILKGTFSEQDEAVLTMISMAIEKAKAANRPIGLCGQAPSDFPEFAQFLVSRGIDSISFNPDALLKGIQNISAAEARVGEAAPLVHSPALLPA